MLLYKLLEFLQSMFTVANAEKVWKFIEPILVGGFEIFASLALLAFLLSIIWAMIVTPLALLFQGIKWGAEDIVNAIKLKRKKVE